MNKRLYSIKAGTRTYWVVGLTPAQALSYVQEQTSHECLVTVEEMGDSATNNCGLVAWFPGPASD